MGIKPFLKWAGGKRWLINRDDFRIPDFEGRYIEPFLGGGAIFFSVRPRKAVLADLNPRLIETYDAIKRDYKIVHELLARHQEGHSKDYYYVLRAKKYDCAHERAAQFLYLNRACWNGLYRENLRGQFNVPIGTKTAIIFENENFSEISEALNGADLITSDFEAVVGEAKAGDFLFVDPPYTTAHNMNGFVKYNEKIFSWEDQKRLANAIIAADARGVKICMTNANHKSIEELYQDNFSVKIIQRHSVISGAPEFRSKTSELIISTRFRGGLS